MAPSALKSKLPGARQLLNITGNARKFALLAVAAGIYLAGNSAFGATTGVSDTVNIDNAGLAVWRIVNAKQTFSATAWAAGQKKFITNAHVIARLVALGSGRIHLTQYRNGRSVRVAVSRILALTVTYDLAIIETEQPAAHFLTISDLPSEAQEENLIMIGYSGTSFDIAYQTAKIIYEDHLSYHIAMNKTVFGGSSGSPLLDSRGRVVTILHRAFESTNLISAVKPTNLQTFQRGEIGVRCADMVSPRQCIQRALSHARNMARSGNPISQFQLGADGPFYVGRDWLSRSAEQGFPAAQYVLGTIAKRSRNWDGAARWYKLAAKQRHAVAQMALARLYYSGSGIPRNHGLVFWLTRQSAKSGLYDAQRSLGYCHYVGIGTPINREKGVFWFKAAAKNGDKEAKHILELIGLRQ